MQRRVDIECTATCRSKEAEGDEVMKLCVQECSSPTCFTNVIKTEVFKYLCIYFNIFISFILKLEEGEIDTRESRFKICLLEDMKRRKTRRDEGILFIT